MLRNSLLAIGGVLVAGLLMFLTNQSNAVDSEYYVDYGSKINLLRQSETDFSALSEAVQNAYREGRAVPNSALVAMQRVNSARDEFKAQVSSADSESIAGAFSEYEAALDASNKTFDQFVAAQRTLANNVGIVRNESPAIVRDLRRYGLQSLSQSVFGLAVGVMDFASGTGGQTAQSLLQRIDEIANDPQVRNRIPGKLDALVGASREILNNREASASLLSKVEASALPGASRTLQATLRTNNRAIVGRADRARTLLAVFSLLFLGGIGYTAFMLRRSYADLSDSKNALEHLNHSLEERVDARTEQLSGAYDELKESQSQLVHAEKMSSLGELVAGISHEINTPLWYLLSNATLLQERLTSFDAFVAVTEDLLNQLRDGDKDKQKFVRRLQELDNMILNESMRDDLEESQDLVKDSIEGLEQLAEMAQSLKDFSRLDRAAVDHFIVNDGLDKSLVIAKNFLKNRVTVHKDFEEVPPIMCSPSQINQIFLNLIKNASDAIEGTGDIYISTRHVGENVVTTIRDTGSGIPADVMAKIRDPFFTTKEVGKGTGLGLSIVDKIINSHFGELTIESEEGQGATFTVSLPVSRKSENNEGDDLEAQIDALNDMPVAAAG